MATITKCLNEWNVIVEALGKGKQTILIRNYDTTLEEFLLYPTISYADNENYLNSFKLNYYDFVEKNTFPNSKGKEYEIKYYAKIEKKIKTNSRALNNFDKYHIWDKDHVNNFVRGKTPYIWVLRVYKIQNPRFLSRTRGMKYANVKEEVDISNLTPVLSDEEFNNILSMF